MIRNFGSLSRALAVIFLLAGCATPEVPGNYEATLPEGRGLERHVRLKLLADGRASVSTARWGSFTYVAEGNWKRANDRTVVLDLASAPPQRLVFQHGGDLLVTKEWDRSIWGDKGPGVLYRVH